VSSFELANRFSDFWRDFMGYIAGDFANYRRAICCARSNAI
jgi:hypothetical protein